MGETRPSTACFSLAVSPFFLDNCGQLRYNNVNQVMKRKKVNFMKMRKKRRSVFLSLVMALTCLSLCASAFSVCGIYGPGVYETSAFSSPSEGGTVIIEYNPDGQSSFTAKPNAGYQFVGWVSNGELLNTDPSFLKAFDMDNDLESLSNEIKAVFEVIPSYVITVNAMSGGNGTGGGTYLAGDTVTVTASEMDGYHFTGWFKDGVKVSDETVYSFVVTGDAALTARFASHSFSSTVTTPASCTEPGVRTYTCPCGAQYTAPIPAAGHYDDGNDGICDICGDMMNGEGQCPQCGKVHDEPLIGWLIAIIHRVVYTLTHLFQLPQ